MDEGNGGDRPSIDLQRDNIKDTERQVVAIASAIAPSLVFNAVAMPPNLPDHVQTALLAKAGQDRDAAVEAGFAMPAGEHLVEGKTVQEREKERDEKAITYAALVADEIEDQRRQREEASYQEWRQTRHTYAGQTMDGEDWHRLINWFRDPANAAEWEDAMMRETGQTREDVRQTGGKMKRFYDLMEKDARGSMTKDERAEFDKLNADKDVKRGIEVQQEVQGFQQSRNVGVPEASEVNYDGKSQENAISFASTFADEASVSNKGKLPALSSLYSEAANGKPKVSPPEPSALPGLPRNQVVQVNLDNIFG